MIYLDKDEKVVNIKAVFIDIDNTLLDFDAYVVKTLSEGFKKYDIAEFQPWMLEIFHVENNKLWKRIEEGTLCFEELEKVRFNNYFSKIGVEFDGPFFEKYFRSALNECAIPVEDAIELLDYLSQKYIVCAASNGPFDQQLNRIKIAGMDQYFDYYFISSDIGASKPSGDFYAEAFKRLNQGRSDEIKPKETIMIGDSLTSDMAGGRNYGMHTCYYNRSGQKIDNFEYDIMVASLCEIAKMLG